MARRHKNSDAGGGLIVLAGVMMIVACVLVFIVIPAAVFIWWLAAESFGLGQRGLRTLADVSATGDEQVRETELTRRIGASQAVIAAAHRDGDHDGLRRRADGMFDERSYRGRDLNIQIGSEGRTLSQAQADLGVHRGFIRARVDRWVNRKSMVTGARAGLIAFVVVGATMLCLQPAAAEKVGSWNVFSDKADQPTRMLLGSLAIAGLCSWAVNGVAFAIRRKDLVA